MTALTTDRHLDARPPAPCEMRGRLLTSADPDWDDSRAAFNLTVDVHPAAIAFPTDTDDVAAALDVAKSHGWRVAIRATGHNLGAHSDLSEVLLIDLRNLRGVAIDEETGRVTVGGGVTWQEVVPALSRLGRAALHGSSPLVGIAGYSLGGGVGWLARKHGLQTNSITGLEVVDATGTRRWVDPERDPDLFWALRGGNGNFGVVTALEFDTVAVDGLYAGAMFFPIERAKELLETWSRLADSLPDELMTWVAVLHVPDLPEVPEPLRGGSFAILQGAFLGSATEGAGLLSPIRALGPALDTFATVEPAALAELAMDPTEPVPYQSTTALLDSIPEDLVAGLLEASQAGPQPPLVLVQLRHAGGALARAPHGAGARATLPGRFCLFTLGIAFDEETAAATRSRLAAVDEVVATYRVGEYPNFVEHPGKTSRFFDATTWARLCRIKAAHDPAGLFLGNHAIAAPQGQ